MKVLENNLERFRNAEMDYVWKVKDLKDMI